MEVTFRSINMYSKIEGHCRKRNNSMWLCSDHDQFGLFFSVYYRYPLLRLDLTFGSHRNSAPISLDFCKHTLVVSIYMFRVFFPAENDTVER